MAYRVLSCTHCDGTNIIDSERSEQLYCNFCREKLDPTSASHVKETSTRKTARKIRNVREAARVGRTDYFEEIIQEGKYAPSIVKSATDPAMLRELGLTLDDLFDGESSLRGEVKRAIENLDHPTDEKLVSELEASPEEVESTVDSLCRRQEAMRTKDGEIELLQ